MPGISESRDDMVRCFRETIQNGDGAERYPTIPYTQRTYPPVTRALRCAPELMKRHAFFSPPLRCAAKNKNKSAMDSVPTMKN